MINSFHAVFEQNSIEKLIIIFLSKYWLAGLEKNEN